jgi:hypothetical protein
MVAILPRHEQLPHSPTDRTDAAWDLLAAHLPAASSASRPQTHRDRAIRDAICSSDHPRCAWRGRPLGSLSREAGVGGQPSTGTGDSQRATTTGVGGVRGSDEGMQGACARWAVCWWIRRGGCCEQPF